MKTLFCMLTMLLSTPAFALFEIRGHYGTMNSNPSGFNKQMEDYVVDAPNVGAPTNIGVDGIFKFPILPLAVGLRYETLSFKKDGTGRIGGVPVSTKTELKGSRTSFLAGFRLISLPIAYLGVLAHYNLSQDVTYTMKSNNGGPTTLTDKFKSKKFDAGYGVGLEGGAYIGRFLAGAEVGYTMMKVNGFKDADGEMLDDSSRTIKMDLSGTYFKLVAGVTF